MPALSGQLGTGNKHAGFAVIWEQEIPPTWLLNLEVGSGIYRKWEAKKVKTWVWEDF